MTVTENSPSRNQSRNNISLNPMSKSFTLGDPRSKSQKRVPGLDFSNLKHVKEYKDWYVYAKKLEDALSLLRQKIKDLEEENDELTIKAEKAIQKCEQLHSDYLNSQDNLKRVRLELDQYKGKDDSFNDNSGNKSRKSKRIMSMAQMFNKKNLTLQIEQIEKDAEEAQAYQMKKPVKSDSQEDSPIREGNR